MVENADYPAHGLNTMTGLNFWMGRSGYCLRLEEAQASLIVASRHNSGANVKDEQE